MDADQLGNVKLLADLSPGDVKRLAKQLRDVRPNAGDKIMIRGQGGVGFMMILEGETEITTADGRTRLLGPGDHFGEMTLLDHERRSADVTAKTDLLCATIPEWGFEAFLLEHPKVAYRLLQTMSRRLREAETR